MVQSLDVLCLHVQENVIESGSESGHIPDVFDPTVKLHDVKFAFPSRPNIQVSTSENLVYVM